AEHWAELFPHFRIHPAALAQDLGELLRQRLASLLEDAGVEADLVQAVAGETVPVERLLRDPADARQRVDLLVELRENGRLEAVRAVVTRAARLAEKAELRGDVLAAEGVVDPNLFEKPSEAAMLDVLRRLEPVARAGDAHSYAELAEALAESAGTLSAFFDGEQSVMVMADDPAVRRNRLHLLAVLRNQASVLAEFSRVTG
nr:DALR anticodon-binding domain-containing protein [Cyanobium sp. Prado107]